MLYRFLQTRQPGPGTQSYAFEPRFALPSFLGFRGPGKYAGSLAVLQPPQLVYLQTVTTASVANGGVVAGQIFGQPLINKGQS